MAQYGKVEGGVITKVRQKDNPDTVDGGDGFPVWRPITSTPRPAYDSATHHAPVEEQGISIGKAIVNNGATIVQSWLAPVAKTAQEISDEKDVQATNTAADRRLQVVKVMMSDAFEQENRIRALEGDGPLSVVQYVAKLQANPTVPNARFIEIIRALL